MKYKAAVLTVSDKCSRGEREDTSGPALCAMLEQAGFELAWTGVVPDETQLRALGLTSQQAKSYIQSLMLYGKL